jgi:hypothetical protein
MALKTMNNKELEAKVKQAVHALAFEKGFVCAVDLLLRLGYLTRKDYEAWRFGKVAYLEKVCSVNLGKLSLINRATQKFAAELKLKSSWTAYMEYGKGAKRKLIFSKSGDRNIEMAYATHYLDKVRINELKNNKNKF